ncbi:putative RNA-binding protein, snRNP like protein [Candidatus Nitrososphaera evergladensis SR1]|uniref:Putative RNA-binding protein, snRNP like protein n=1 Tax=Candidatus Nitrososphaera evergladensis SR1 TaxID=1459636 RepID=A0A075MXH1_9ARCH|nr:ribosome rescue protein RqcH [Candidatus Nitrososphaera evergladensis]AIF85312.1 putative RNA-binding protein, snRNP like protein [Candidatus Nitrososphaera evergladensis SR1]
MELSGVELRYLVNEIGARVTSGHYISAVNAVTKDSLLLRLHHPTQEDIMLVLSARGIWITKLKFKPVEDNSLERAAIAELERARVESLEQAGSERIATLRLRRLDGQARVVVCEFFGDGNIIICDEKMQMLAILRPIEVRHRTLKVGLRYAFPPQRGVDVFALSLEQMLALRNEAKNLDVLRWIGRGLSMPKKFVEEVAKRAGIEPSRQAGQLADEEVGRIFSTIKSLVDDISAGRNHEPVVIMQGEKPVDALPIVTQEAQKLEVKKAPTYMEALDEVLSNEILDIGRSSRTIEIDRQIAVLEHDLAEQNKAKEEVLQKAAAIRKLAGELMAVSYSNPADDAIKGVLAANSASLVTEKGVKYVQVAGENIEAQQNLAKLSSMLFARAKEMERGNASIEEARSKLLAQIERLRGQTAAIHKKMVVQKQAAKEWYERYRWFVTSDGLLAIGGRDASSNSALVRKHLTEDDIVFHAEVHGSPFFIVKNAAAPAREGKMEQSLVQVAQATVSFSRAWKDGLSSADAYWVFPDQIKKGAPTGQFLPKGSFVIEGKRSYVKGVEVRLAIGIELINEREALVCGPEEAVKKRSLVYAVLLQGGLDPMNAAKKAKATLVSAAAGDNEELAETIKRISLDDFVRSLPTGQSKISFASKGSTSSKSN